MKNREIKFRAWEKSTKQMHDVVQIDFKSWVAIPVPAYINDEGDYDWHLEQRRIDEFVLMQYTGLKDKNGKEIYEGDILLHSGWSNKGLNTGAFARKYEVKYDEVKFMFSVGSAMSLYGLSSIDYGTLEIIGNIYENPELLK